MIRIVTLILTLAAGPGLFGQIPPGDQYDPAKHVNPIITYVLSKDFKASNYKSAADDAGITLLGFSKETGTLESVELAPAGVQNIREGRYTVKATFYPVVRQTFKLSDGAALVLHSFKAPKVPATPNVVGGSSGPFGIPLGRERDPRDKRFGSEAPPEQLDIRGRRALLFEKDGSLTVAWLEDGVFHTATSKLGRRAFFDVLDDLL